VKTVRAIISGALTKWYDKGDPIEGKCTSVKLVHMVDNSPHPQKIEAWPTPAGCDINQVIGLVEEAARDHAGNKRSGIVEEYAIIPYFKSGAEGGFKNFTISSIVENSADGDGSSIGEYTEGANSRGEKHQDMRHKEAMARIFVDGISRNQEVSQKLLDTTMARNEKLEITLDTMRTEVEDAKDRSIERQLAVFKTYEEEKRTTRLIEGLLPAGMMIANAAIGRPLFPVSSDDTTVNMFKDWVRSLTVEQMETFREKLDPAQFMPLLMAKSQVIDEDEEKEKKTKADAAKEVQGIMQNQEAQASIARRDVAGIPRDPIVGK